MTKIIKIVVGTEFVIIFTKKLTTMLDYEEGTPKIDKKYQIKIVANGPYLVYGKPPIRVEVVEPDASGIPWSYRTLEKNYTLEQEPTALCRCGHSKNPPYCDGEHMHHSWDERLTASRRPMLESAETTEGPTLILADNPEYCSFARFCDAKGRTWNQVMDSHIDRVRELAIRTANMCPAGRLKVWDSRTGKCLELPLEPSIGVLEDPLEGCGGPLWVKGGIPITDPEGFTYQVRNRVALCRCGNSRNKPLCDGTHAPAQYKDGIAEE